MFLDVKTCICEEVIYTNFHLQQPYTTLEIDVNSFEIQCTGLLPTILQKLIQETCGVCQITSTTNYTSRMSLTSNGNGGTAFKGNRKYVLDEIDLSTKSLLSFPMIYAPNDLSVFVAVVKYPGAVLLNRKIDSTELVHKILGRITSCWTILLIYLLGTFLSAMVLWSLVRTSIFNLISSIFHSSFKCSQLNDSKRSV